MNTLIQLLLGIIPAFATTDPNDLNPGGGGGGGGTLLSGLNDMFSGIATDASSIAFAIVGALAAIVGSILVIKAINAFRKTDYKNVGLFTLFAILTFAIAGLFIGGTIGSMGNKVIGGKVADIVNDAVTNTK